MDQDHTNAQCIELLEEITKDDTIQKLTKNNAVV
jgi:hypothetical protein